MLRKLVLVSALVAFPTSFASAQTEGQTPGAGNLGLSFGLNAGGGASAGATYFLTNTLSLHGELGLNVAFAPATAAAFDILLAARFYLSKDGPVAGFFEPGVQIGNPQSQTRFALSGGFGLEYFFNEHLSAAGVIRLSIGGGAGAFNLYTGDSGLTINIYW